MSCGASIRGEPEVEECEICHVCFSKVNKVNAERHIAECVDSLKLVESLEEEKPKSKRKSREPASAHKEASVSPIVRTMKVCPMCSSNIILCNYE